MKGFFILILLSACAQPANSTPYKEEQKSKILTEATNTTLSSPSDSIEMSAEPSKDSEDNLGEYLFMTEDEIASYMSGIHGADFKVFLKLN